MHERQPDVALRSTTGRWLMLVTVIGSGMVFLDSTVVNVALPSIGRAFHASTGALQWVLSGYLLSLASLILLGGSLGDRLGRRRVFVAGAVVFTCGSLACAVAPSVGLLIAARILQGVGGALLTPGSLAMIEAVLREEDRPRGIGAWSGMTGVATALGPLVGGYLIAAVSWRAAFLINLPLGVLVVAVADHVPETTGEVTRGGLDVRGAVLAFVALAGVTFALIEGPAGGAQLAVALAAAAGVLAALAFVVVERHSASPMLPLDIFTRQFTAANVLTLVIYAAFGGVFFLLVAFLQISLGYSPLAAGAATLPITLLMLLLSSRAGMLAQRIGPRLPLTAGSLVVAAGMFLMIRIDPGDSYAASVLPAVAVFGAGLTLVVSPITATVLASASERRAGIASAVNNAVARVAGLFAVAFLPALAGLTGHRFYVPAAMTHGFHVAVFACALLAVVGAVVAWFTIDNAVLQPRGTLDTACGPGGEPAYSCAVGAPPLRPGAEPDPAPGGLPA
ncbi:MAG TPA: MFS transporter [Solirubrobacteraceae bacterium]|nr:MFS transporter [Solirubrobacteraceae bacterium]